MPEVIRNFTKEGTRFKFALLLTGLASLFIWFDRLDGTQWVWMMQWIYTAFAIARVAVPIAQARNGGKK